MRCNIQYGEFDPAGPDMQFYVGQHTVKSAYGVGAWEATARKLGLNTILGTITKKFGDSIATYPFAFDFYVVPQNAVLEIDSMKTVYRDLPNRISIDVPGYTAAQINLRVPGARVEKAAPGQYDVWITSPATQLKAYADATNPQGVTMTVYSTTLNIREAPGPIALLNNATIDTLPVSDLAKHATLTLRCTNEDLNIPYRLTQYSLFIRKPGNTLIGPVISAKLVLNDDPQIAPLLSHLQPGDRLDIAGITATWKGRGYVAAPVSIVVR
jgi:hypothetical protein